MSAHQGTGSNTSAAVRLLVCAFGVLGAIDAVKASTGDRDFAFRQCTSLCETTGCIQLQVGKQLIRSGCDAACPGPNRKPVPLHLMLTQWTCHDDCRYVPVIQLAILSMFSICYDSLSITGLRTIIKNPGPYHIPHHTKLHE